MWLGSMPTTADDYMTLVDNFDRLLEFNHAKDLGTKHMVKAFGGNNTAFAKFVEAKENSLLKATYWPIDDGEFKGAIEVYSKAFEFYKKERMQDRELRFYIHCHNGKHRSAHFILYMLMLGGMDYVEAFNWLHSKRNVIEQKLPLKAQLITYFEEQPAHLVTT